MSAEESGRPDLFIAGFFHLASGADSRWKIECDALSDLELEVIAALLAARVPAFHDVVGVPRGGERLAAALKRYEVLEGVDLIVDDVWTTGQSMMVFIERQLSASERLTKHGAVIFAREPTPTWVTPLWTLAPPRVRLG